MKNKSLTYILLIVVAIIWYQVFFRIKDNLVDEGNANSLTSPIQKQLISLHRDTFRLETNYRDPFQKVMPIVERQKPQFIEPNPEIVKEKKEKPQVQWAPIKYYGFIKKTESKDPLAVLNVDGDQFFLRKGEEVFDGYKVIAIYRDSVLISFRKMFKYYHKK